MIDGVVVKELETHSDQRGFFREIIRTTDDFFEPGFGQWSHSLMYQGVVKAWHLHRLQTDWWYVGSGVLRVALRDQRPESRTHKQVMDLVMGEGQAGQVLTIPPGVAHGCKVIQGPVNLFYITSKVYNPDDELRLPHDQQDLGIDWLAGPPIT